MNNKIPTMMEFLRDEGLLGKLPNTIIERLNTIDVRRVSLKCGKSKINADMFYANSLQFLVSTNTITEEQAQKLWKERISSE